MTGDAEVALRAEVAPTAPPRPAPRRFRRRLLLVLSLAGLLPLLVWGSLGRWVLEAALGIAPPLGSLMAQAAQALDGQAVHTALAGQLRAAELHLMQADLARRRLLEFAPLAFVIALLASGGLVALGAFLLGRRLSRPIEVLADAMDRLGRGQLTQEVPRSGRGDELDHLADEFNRMARELARQRARLQVTEALAAWRDAARALAHDLKNPLTAMRMALARVSRGAPGSAAATESLALLEEELGVLVRMSDSFSEFARLPEPRPRPLELSALVSDVASLYAEQGAKISLDLPAPALVLADADQLRRAVGNLIKNAIEASADVTPIEIVLRASNSAEQIELRVRDRGRGLAAPIEGAALMRGLASSKGSDRGLGLPIAHKIVHDHGGRLRLQPAAGGGAEAVIELPRAPISMSPMTPPEETR